MGAAAGRGAARAGARERDDRERESAGGRERASAPCRAIAEKPGGRYVCCVCVLCVHVHVYLAFIV